jgi:plastocyanin
MKQLSKGISNPVTLFTIAAILIAGAATGTLQAEEWNSLVGAESLDRGSQALAFLPNELWVHAGDSIRWSFPTHERHTLTFLKPGQTRPPGFGPVFGVPVGCPGLTPDGSSFDGSACVTSGVLQVPDQSTGPVQTYSVTFPSAGNFKFVCLIHADMTGVVHVLDVSQTLPHDHDFYDRQAQSMEDRLFADASSLRGRGTHAYDENPGQSNVVAAGVGEIVTSTGVGSQTASLMRFLTATINVHVGDTVEWSNLDPSINHTVTFGIEPADPRPPLNVALSSDGARQAVITSPTDNVNSGFLTPTPQDRAGLAQASPNVTRFRVTFTSPGTFNYICAVHDQLGMKGTVIVHP